MLGERDEPAGRAYLGALPQRGSPFVRRLQVAQVVERHPDFGCQEPGLLLARGHLPVADVRMRRRQSLDDRLAPERGFVPLGAEVDLMPAARERVNHRFDVAVIAVVERGEENFHRPGPRSRARCVNIRISYTALRLARRLLPATFLAATSV